MSQRSFLLEKSVEPPKEGIELHQVGREPPQVDKKPPKKLIHRRIVTTFFILGTFVVGAVVISSVAKMSKDVKIVEWEKWSSWSPCNVTCGRGMQTRKRQCKGDQCAGSDEETQNCNGEGCEATTGGNSNGAPCVFPFTYRRVVYRMCTDIDHDKAWCATTDSLPRDRLWGECKDQPTDGENRQQLYNKLFENFLTIPQTNIEGSFEDLFSTRAVDMHPIDPEYLENTIIYMSCKLKSQLHASYNASSFVFWLTCAPDLDTGPYTHILSQYEALLLMPNSLPPGRCNILCKLNDIQRWHIAQHAIIGTLPKPAHNMMCRNEDWVVTCEWEPRDQAHVTYVRTNVTVHWTIHISNASTGANGTTVLISDWPGFNQGQFEWNLRALGLPVNETSYNDNSTLDFHLMGSNQFGVQNLGNFHFTLLNISRYDSVV